MIAKKDTAPAASHAWVRNLRRLMDERGFNPRSLSLRAGLNATAVRDMIEGRSRFPRYDTVQALADALGITPAFLMSSEAAAPGESAFGPDIELLAEIIARLQETAADAGRKLSPREFAAMAATIYRRLNDEPGARKKGAAALEPQIHDLLKYESLRAKRK